MGKIYVFLAEGFEEVEALAVVDLLRRADLDVVMVSIMGELVVKGSHNIGVLADCLFEDVDYNDAELLFLPGGMPGKVNLQKFLPLQDLIQKHTGANKIIVAICAAPAILGNLGLLEGKKATVFPGFEDEMKGAIIVKEKIVISDNYITARGMGTAIDLGLELIKLFKGKDLSDRIAKSTQYVL